MYVKNYGLQKRTSVDRVIIYTLLEAAGYRENVLRPVGR